MKNLQLARIAQRVMTRGMRLATGLCLFGLASCRSNTSTLDDSLAVGRYDLETVNGKAVSAGRESRFALVVARSTVLNADHTFSDSESIRIVGGPTSNWSSRGTWTLDGIKLVKVHAMPAGPLTELATLVGDTLNAGSSVFARR